MERSRVKIGFAPTRRTFLDIASAQEQRARILKRISCVEGVDVIDINDVNEEGLLWQRIDVEKVIRKFKDAEVDALFFPHCNFGSEVLVSEVSKALNVPILLWGPRDDAPNIETGMRNRDSQCGLFATGKVLRRFNLPFTYLTNSHVESDFFLEGFKRFVSVANVVKTARRIRVLQVGPRPDPFNSVIVNEGELVNKFGIQVFTVNLTEFGQRHRAIKMENGREFQRLCQNMKTNYEGPAIDSDEAVKNFAALKLTLNAFASEHNCNCCALYCWQALHDTVGVAPCFVNSLLSEDGFPVSCETDINGAISALLLQAATLNTACHFFADVTVRHPTEENIELLWHCGPFPNSLAREKGSVCGRWIGNPETMGNCFWQLKRGPITICRFDGDSAGYSLLTCEGEGVDGPKSVGSYVWFEVKDLPALEHKLVTGPYIHHVAGVYGNFAEVLYEACKYIPGLIPDPAEPAASALADVWIHEKTR